MDGVISSLLVALLLSLAFSSSTQQQSLSGNSTEFKTSYKESHKFSQLNKKIKKWLETNEETFDAENEIIISDTPTPAIDQPLPANGSIPDDGCGSTSVRFDDGNCYPLMGRQPCGDPQQWVTVDPYTFKGRCTPRLCGRDRVFVPRTGLCHDIYDTSECRGGRRLYYSQYGKPVCDCPIGQFPFPNPQDDCVALFTRGPCPYGQVVNITSDGSMSCMKSNCPTIYESNEYSSKLWKQKQMVPTSDGKCYELGSADPCSNDDETSSLLGFDILKNELVCVDITDPSSPYYFSKEENDLLDSVFDGVYQE
ncbi:uncharacterized protein LOC124209732 [Daphnia pulex]|uniref:uncharacterized protein LOC124209732 n=1 Tax=Daphnia pulex TaxID=6669 RepID=UPI001EDDB157|nr:uncharacterized protein LOC124209732 [Daphnia pulex]